MNEIGNSFKEARMLADVSLEEASEDTEIPVAALEQIEDGSIGSFKDIFKLKDYLKLYSKYLGLDGEAVIDEFNEYMFEYTSKIPIGDIEKKIAEANREQEEQLKETQEIKAISPYLKAPEKNGHTKAILISIIIILLVAIALIWAVQLITR